MPMCTEFHVRDLADGLQISNYSNDDCAIKYLSWQIDDDITQRSSENPNNLHLRSGNIEHLKPPMDFPRHSKEPI